MSSAPSLLADATPLAPARPVAAWRPPLWALALLAAAVVLFAGRTGYKLSTGLWQTEDYAYSPLILATAGYLAWRKRAELGAARSSPSTWGGVLLVIALLMQVIGVGINNITTAVASILLALVGLLALLWGWRSVALLGYPIGTASFCIPLPGSLVASLTFPLKMIVSTVAAKVLLLLGFPISRAGVVIEIGDYRLLVADACSGIQSMFSLAAAALVYLALMEYRSVTRSVILLAISLPIALAANIVRVLVLALITYFFGDAAGQGFLHGFAGVVMFVVAFGGLMILDGLLSRFLSAEASQ